MASKIEISEATEADYDAIWEIFQPILATGRTYVYSPETSKEEAKSIWFGASWNTYIAKVEGDPVGAYVIRPAHRDLGSHIANAAYIVANKFRGNGYGEMLGRHSIKEAAKHGYSAMQFNYVVSTNVTAIKLWTKLGFKIVGTIPKAYAHPGSDDQTNVHIMHRFLGC